MALAAYVGTATRVPAPFGPARNGLIPYASNGDIYLGDPLTGQTRLLSKAPRHESGAVVSPDGTRVAFATRCRWQDPTDVYVMESMARLRQDHVEPRSTI